MLGRLADALKQIDFLSNFFGSDEFYYYTSQYSWYANQFGHLLIGFFVVDLLAWIRFLVDGDGSSPDTRFVWDVWYPYALVAAAVAGVIALAVLLPRLPSAGDRNDAPSALRLATKKPSKAMEWAIVVIFFVVFVCSLLAAALWSLPAAWAAFLALYAIKEWLDYAFTAGIEGDSFTADTDELRADCFTDWGFVAAGATLCLLVNESFDLEIVGEIVWIGLVVCFLRDRAKLYIPRKRSFDVSNLPRFRDLAVFDYESGRPEFWSAFEHPGDAGNKVRQFLNHRSGQANHLVIHGTPKTGKSALAEAIGSRFTTSCPVDTPEGPDDPQRVRVRYVTGFQLAELAVSLSADLGPTTDVVASPALKSEDVEIHDTAKPERNLAILRHADCVIVDQITNQLLRDFNPNAPSDRLTALNIEPAVLGDIAKALAKTPTVWVLTEDFATPEARDAFEGDLRTIVAGDGTLEVEFVRRVQRPGSPYDAVAEAMTEDMPEA